MVIEAAHALAKAIQASEVFKTYQELDSKLCADPTLKAKVDLFQGKQFALQRAHLSGASVDPGALAEVETLFKELTQHELMTPYFQAEMAINQMMSEVTKIIGEAMDFRKQTQG